MHACSGRCLWLSLCALTIAACGSPVHHQIVLGGQGGDDPEQSQDATLPPPMGGTSGTDAGPKDAAPKSGPEGGAADGMAADKSSSDPDAAMSDGRAAIDVTGARPDVPNFIPIPIPTSYPTGPGPISVTLGADGGLITAPDPSGDVIPDFSYAGYRGGGVRIPDVPVVTTLMPVAGEKDALARIQGAIDALAAEPLGASGFRGAILLKKGVYPISNGLVISTSGIVLRGEGDGTDGSILRLVTAGATIVSLEGTDYKRTEIPATRHNLTDAYVPVGARWFRVDSTDGLMVGDSVIIVRPSTAEWIHAIGMDAIPPRSDGTPSIQWKPGTYNQLWDRVIVAIQDDRVMVDAPIVQSIDAKYGGGYVYRYEQPGRVENVGVEKLRGESTVMIDTDGDFAGGFAHLDGVYNAWLSQVTANYLRGSFNVVGGKWITIEDATFRRHLPADTSGAVPDGFTFDEAQLLFFQRITSVAGGHDVSSGARAPGPNVYLDGAVTNTYSQNGPHQRWAVATLYDNIKVAGVNANLSVKDASWEGSGHGWQGANHLFWNCEAPAMTCTRPPTTHQWNVGSVTANNNGNCEWSSLGKHVPIPSIYRAQLAARLGPDAVKAIARRP